jgi:Ca-activated chloride channel family protein
MKRSCPIHRYRKLPGILFAGLLFMSLLPLQAQNERKVIREGIKAYERGDFSEAEVQFRKAGDINQESFEAEFNTGAALYGQEKYEETVKQYEPLVSRAEDPASVAHVWHNIGNSLLEARQYAQSIEAYKNSLRLNPDDMDTKYNLAYAKKKLQDQQQQNQDQQQQQQNRDQQPQPLQISREDAERMLDAIQQQEKDVKEKVDMKKAAVAKVRTEKDW